MTVVDVALVLIGGYMAYKLEKIDRRQDKIEIDLELIKTKIPKRDGDHHLLH